MSPWVIIRAIETPLMYRAHDYAGQGTWVPEKARATPFETGERAAAVAAVEGGMAAPLTCDDCDGGNPTDPTVCGTCLGAIDKLDP